VNHGVRLPKASPEKACARSAEHFAPLAVELVQRHRLQQQNQKAVPPDDGLSDQLAKEGLEDRVKSGLQHLQNGPDGFQHCLNDGRWQICGRPDHGDWHGLREEHLDPSARLPHAAAGS